MPRPEKVQAVDAIKDSFRGAGAVLVTEYRGLRVKDLNRLRRDLAGAGARYQVLKNTLVRFAVRDLEFGDLESYLEGPIAIAFCAGDPVAAARVLSDFARTNPNLVVKAGLLQGRVIDTAGAQALANVESREVLLARLAGVAASPLSQAVSLMQALIRNTAVLVNAYVTKREEAGETADAPAPASTAPAAEEAGSAGVTAAGSEDASETADPTADPGLAADAKAETPQSGPSTQDTDPDREAPSEGQTESTEDPAEGPRDTAPQEG